MKVGLAIDAIREVGQPAPRFPDTREKNKWSPMLIFLNDYWRIPQAHRTIT
jgi:hypothetical protein